MPMQLQGQILRTCRFDDLTLTAAAHAPDQSFGCFLPQGLTLLFLRSATEQEHHGNVHIQPSVNPSSVNQAIQSSHLASKINTQGDNKHRALDCLPDLLPSLHFIAQILIIPVDWTS